MDKIRVLTYSLNKIMNQLTSYVYVGKEKDDLIDKNRFICIWDTGASTSCITSNIVKKYNLTSTGKSDFFTGGHCKSRSTDVYSIDLMFRDDFVFNNLRVLKIEKHDVFDIIIGMDVISKGDFAVSNLNGKTSFSFRIPSFGTANFLNENYDKESDQEN